MYNNRRKYEDLNHYYYELSGSIDKICPFSWDSKPPKYAARFAITASNLKNILEDLLKIRELKEKTDNIMSFDMEAMRNNKSAMKAFNQINSINAQLDKRYNRLRNEFIKQFNLAEKQRRKVYFSLSGDEKKRYHKASSSFMSMILEVKTRSSIIPFYTKNYLDYSHQHQMIEHRADERQIDRVTKNMQVDYDLYFDSLVRVNQLLSISEKNNLSNSIKKEVASIRTAIPATVVSIDKNNLEKLRHSSRLLGDLEQTNEILSTAGLISRDNKLKKINEQLKVLRKNLEKAILEERRNNLSLEVNHSNLQEQVDFATDALRVYDDILTDNKRLDKEQRQIRDKRHVLYVENSDHKKSMKKLKEERDELVREYGSYDNMPYDKAVEHTKLGNRVKNLEETKKTNEKYMKEKAKENGNYGLPIEYTNMKEKLAVLSTLNGTNSRGRSR